MSMLTRLIQGTVIAGLLTLTSGCIIAPDRGHDRGDDRDREMHDRDREMHDRDRHCDDRDNHCRDR